MIPEFVLEKKNPSLHFYQHCCFKGMGVFFASLFSEPWIVPLLENAQLMAIQWVTDLKVDLKVWKLQTLMCGTYWRKSKMSPFQLKTYFYCLIHFMRPQSPWYPNLIKIQKEKKIIDHFHYENGCKNTE